MRMRKSVHIIAVTAALLLIFSVLLLRGCFRGAAPTQPDLESHTIQPIEPLKDNNSFLDSEKELMLDSIASISDHIEVMDHTFGTKDSLIYAVAICKELDSGSETALVYITELGTGYINLAEGVLSLNYYDENGIDLKSSSESSVVLLSLLDTHTNETIDYEIVFSKPNPKTIMFDVNAHDR